MSELSDLYTIFADEAPSADQAALEDQMLQLDLRQKLAELSLRDVVSHYSLTTMESSNAVLIVPTYSVPNVSRGGDARIIVNSVQRSLCSGGDVLTVRDYHISSGNVASVRASAASQKPSNSPHSVGNLLEPDYSWNLSRVSGPSFDRKGDEVTIRLGVGYEFDLAKELDFSRAFSPIQKSLLLDLTACTDATKDFVTQVTIEKNYQS